MLTLPLVRHTCITFYNKEFSIKYRILNVGVLIDDRILLHEYRYEHWNRIRYRICYHKDIKMTITEEQISNNNRPVH